MQQAAQDTIHQQEMTEKEQKITHWTTVSKHKTLKMEINKDLKEPMKYNEHKFGSFISKRL